MSQGSRLTLAAVVVSTAEFLQGSSRLADGAELLPTLLQVSPHTRCPRCPRRQLLADVGYSRKSPPPPPFPVYTVLESRNWPSVFRIDGVMPPLSSRKPWATRHQRRWRFSPVMHPVHVDVPQARVVAALSCPQPGGLPWPSFSRPRPHFSPRAITP